MGGNGLDGGRALPRLPGQQTESEGSSVAEGLYAGDDLALEYDLREILGKGTFADVHLGVERCTGELCSRRCVRREDLAHHFQLCNMYYRVA